MNPNNKNTPFFQAYPQIPLFPIYGYDNSEEAEKDFDYMKQLYPRSSVQIQELIEEACDKLEYEGSIMFDEYPDRLQLALMANKIYNQIAPSALSVTPQPDAQIDSQTTYVSGYEEETDVSATAFSSSRHHGRPGRPIPPPPPPGRPGRPMPPPPPPWRPAPPPPAPDHPNWLRNLIEVMLCNEMCQRRRRYRSRKRWM
ncbi:MAG: hypothetical protein OSJ52_02665 [Lachnospiraceae bacterium]|nr:hypothetical protein [Lachnospiraceae bacterium]